MRRWHRRLSSSSKPTRSPWPQGDTLIIRSLSSSLFTDECHIFDTREVGSLQTDTYQVFVTAVPLQPHDSKRVSQVCGWLRRDGWANDGTEPHVTLKRAKRHGFIKYRAWRSVRRWSTKGLPRPGRCCGSRRAVCSAPGGSQVRQTWPARKESSHTGFCRCRPAANLAIGYYVYGHNTAFNVAAGPTFKNAKLETNIGAGRYVRFLKIDVEVYAGSSAG